MSAPLDAAFLGYLKFIFRGKMPDKTPADKLTYELLRMTYFGGAGVYREWGEDPEVRAAMNAELDGILAHVATVEKQAAQEALLETLRKAKARADKEGKP
jgi:hypothetical protein